MRRAVLRTADSGHTRCPRVQRVFNTLATSEAIDDGTIRRHLVHVPHRIATRARTITLHLPQRWCWEADFNDLWIATGQRLRT